MPFAGTIFGLRLGNLSSFNGIEIDDVKRVLV